MTKTRQMSQNELADLIINFQKENNANFQKLNERFDQMSAAIRQDVRDEFQPQVNDLKEEQESLREIIAKQQTLLEQLDTHQRAGNLIVIGLKEEEITYDLTTAVTDRQKVDLLFQEINCDVTVQSVTRLGERIENKPRPMKIALSDPTKTKSALECARKVRDLDFPLNSIRIKKDSHPAIRKEWGRLHEALKNEREKEENAGCYFFIDYKNRELRRDGEVIDRFQNPFA